MDQTGNRPGWSRACSTLLACTVLVCPAIHAQTPIERPGITAVSTDLGRIQPTAPITLTVHLSRSNESAFEQALKGLYTRGSPTYHQWMTKSDFARYAPTAAQVQSVVAALRSYGLSVLSVSSDNLSIRVQGAASDVQSAFQTEIHQFKRKNQIFHANVTPATLAGAAGSLVRGVTGLTSFPMHSNIAYQINPKTGQPLAAQQLASNGLSGIASNVCFGDPIGLDLTTSGAELPIGVYVGATYNNAGFSSGGFPGNNAGVSCSWIPSQLQGYYGLSAAYSQGLDGTGQTVVIVVGAVSAAQLQSDLAQFSSLADLPAITSSNFTVIYPDGQPTQLQIEKDNPNPFASWQSEAALDTEWTHSIAPGAHIVVEILPSQDWAEFELAIDYARQNGLGNVISNSYGSPEALIGAYTVQGFEQVLENAAAAGIAVNFASGDNGDEGTGSVSAGGILYPGSSPHATSVGGTSIGIPNGTSTGTNVGWGSMLTYLGSSAQVLDPPYSFGFQGGSGGGVSTFFAQPSWQQSLSGTARQAPDISALADPFTGVVIVTNGVAQAGVGGTSLACPIFSAIWAIANQAAGASLGQAAPLLYRLPVTAINDVIPPNGDTNVTGILVDSNGERDYSAASLFAPIQTTNQFYSALQTLPGAAGGPVAYLDLGFGIDTSLTVTVGWDNVTGLGVPNGLAFIQAAAAANTN